jgi:hypothetical protein
MSGIYKARILRHTLEHNLTTFLRITAFLAIAAAALLALASPAAAQVSDVPDKTPQTNGIVWAVLPLGNRIYIGGEFTAVDGVPRNNLAAIDRTTGALTSWNPGANRRVAALAASPDGSRIYAGGDFTEIGGITRNRLAALDPLTGAVHTQWRSGTGSTVRAIAVSGNGVYIGGNFQRVQGQERLRLALLDGTTGELDPDWRPAANNQVWTMQFSPDGSRLYVGGTFTSISGQTRSRLAALNPLTGAVDPWRTAVNTNGRVMELWVTTSRVCTAEGGPGGEARAYDTTTGNRVWRLRGDGDAQAITVLDGITYIGGHYINLAGQPRRFFAAADASTGALNQNWAPSGGGGTLTDAYATGVWTLKPDSSFTRIYAGTNFRTVNGQPQAGFVQFSDRNITVEDIDSTPPRVDSTSPAAGEQNVRLDTRVEADFTEALDADTLNENTFILTREGDSAPIASTVSYDPTANRATLTPNSNLEAGRTYTARLTTGVKDIAGNSLAADTTWSFTTTPWTDTAAPTIDQLPEGSFVPNSQLATSGIPVDITWAGTDDDSGISGYELQRSINGGAYTNVRLSSSTATSKRLRLSPGNDYQFRVRATDAAGNQSEWVAGPRFTVDGHQETSPAIAYAGTWTQQSLSTAYGGTLRYAEGAAGERAAFTFTGSEVAWIAPKGPDRGRAEVYIDGVRVGTVDLYRNSDTRPQMAVFTAAVEPGVHTLEIRVLGTKRSASGGTRVDVDAFFVLR